MYPWASEIINYENISSIKIVRKCFAHAWIDFGAIFDIKFGKLTEWRKLLWCYFIKFVERHI